MGLASSIGLGLALARSDKDIVVIDGDGSLLMNMGSLVTIFANNPNNLTWIVIDNGAYGSTGNQDTYAQVIDLSEIAKSVGFKNSFKFEDIDLREIIKLEFIRERISGTMILILLMRHANGMHRTLK